MNRREFLQSAAASALAQAAPQAGRGRSAVVLGAGLAGLAAAHELQKGGWSVTVLEARHRAGGRVLTLREPFSDGLYAEAGALFIPSTHRTTLRFARQFGLALQPIFPRAQAEIYHIRGRRIVHRPALRTTWPLDLTPEEASLGLGGMWQRYIADAVREAGDPAEEGWPPAALAALDSLSFYDFLRRRGASPDAIALLRLGYLDLWGDGIETVSALSLLRDLALRGSERTTYAIQGGNDLLPRAFAERLKNQIHYGAAVTGIEQSDSRVTVHYRQGGLRKRLSADRAVCTLPFTVLRSIPVAPAFSPEKAGAIRDLPSTSVTRVYLQCRQRFWKKAGLPGTANTDLSVMWLWEPTVNQPGPRGILESYSSGQWSRRASALREPDRLEWALKEMEKVYPGLRVNYEVGASKSWDDDEWSRGDYAWFRPGQLTTLGPHLARPEGRIHFAGDHTSLQPGWMQGALDSGLRAAAEVLAAKE